MYVISKRDNVFLNYNNGQYSMLITCNISAIIENKSNLQYRLFDILR